MKRVVFILSLISIVGCYDDTLIWESISEHESRIVELEKACEEMNSNLVSIRTIVEALKVNECITGVTPLTENGKEVGYVVTFDKFPQITIYNGKDGNDGKNGETPDIGVRKDTDDRYYWTLNGEWMLDQSGNKIPTTGADGKDGSQGVPGIDGEQGVPGIDGNDGVTPQLKIENGYWMVSYGSGNDWVQLGKASGDPGDSFFQSVTHDDKSVIFTLADGLVLTVPKVISLAIDFDMDIPLIVQENSSLDINYSVTSVLPDVEVEALCSGDVVALVIPDEADCMRGVIRMEISDTLRYEYTKVVVLVSNGEKVIMKTIKFEDEKLALSDEVVITVPAEGGVAELPYFANVDCDLFIPADAQTWIGPSVETKGYSERRYPVVVAQNTEHYRKAVVTLLSPFGKFALNYIIEQSGEKAVTEEVLEAGLVKCWETQYVGTYSWMTQMYEFIMPASGLIGWKGYRRTDDWIQCRTLTLYPDTRSNLELYRSLYDGVAKCNELLELLAESQVDQSVSDEVEGEARFIRGWMYFTLSRFYGDVPLLLDNPQDINAVDSSRVAYSSVYKQVLEDLSFAEQNMRSAARQQAVTGGHLCRPHKWAATAMKAQVYTQIACLLENKDYQFFDLRKPGREPDFTFAGIASAEDAWSKALETAESVINCGEYKLEEDYASLFHWGAGKPVYQSKERIFVLQNGNMSGLKSFMAIRTLPQYWNNGTIKNSNWGRMLPSRFPVVKWCRVHGGEKYNNSYGLDGLFRSCHDPRYDISYIHTRYTNMSTGMTTQIYPIYSALGNDNYFMPFFRKYSDPETYDGTYGYADMYMIRLAEMYLIAAEASASLSYGPGDSNWNKALEYMEVLHARARVSGSKQSSSPAMSDWTLETREDLVNAIMWERVFELHGEGCHEFFDTHRRGAKWMSEWLVRPLNEFNQEPEQNVTRSSSTTETYFSTFWGSTIIPEDPDELRKVLLAPIPTGAANSDMYGDQMYNDFYL